MISHSFRIEKKNFNSQNICSGNFSIDIMAKLDSKRGSHIRETYSGEKERSVCERHGLEQVGGSNTKIDGTNGLKNASIKNASGTSTQVHLTTQKKFIEVMELCSESATFINLFCGSEEIKNKNKDRYSVNEIDAIYKTAFEKFLNANKESIIDLIIRNGFDVTHVIFNDIKNNIEYELTYEEILERTKNCEWKFLRGGIHLKNANGKTYFHLQREGKRNKNSRYNVLWHIHKHLFI